MRLIWINDNRIRESNFRLSLALSDGISKADAEEGQVIVMEIRDDSPPSPFEGHTFLMINQFGLSNVFLSEPDNSSELRKSIKIPQELLKRYGSEAMSKASGDSETPVSSYSYVSMPCNNHYRDNVSFGYFPARDLKYGIIIWLKKEEESEVLK